MIKQAGSCFGNLIPGNSWPYISNELTTKGIPSIASLSDRVVRNGNHLKNEMENQFKACWEVFFCTLSTIHSLLVACKTNQRCQFLNQVHLKQNRVLITVSPDPMNNVIYYVENSGN